MAALILPSRRVVQPQGPVALDAKFANGLVFAYNGGSDSLSDEGVGRKSTGTKTASTGLTGKAASFNGSTDSLDITNTQAALPNGMSFLYLAKRRRSGEIETVLAKGRANLGFESSLFNTYAGTPAAVHADFNGGSGQVKVNLGYVNGVKNNLNGTFATVVGDWYAVAGMCSTIPDSTYTFRLANVSTGQNFSGAVDVALAAVWSRRLSEHELKSLTENPWQLFRPIQRRIWVPVAGGGATNYSLTADVGSYALAGVDAGVRFSPRLTADAGSYALTGSDAGLAYGRRLLADVGSYSLTGVDATLTYVPASGAYTLTADTGDYSLTGNDAGLTFARSMTADVGSYTLNGVDAGLLVGRRLTADAGAYSLAGVDAALIYTALGPTAYALTAETGSYVLGGNAAGLTYTDGGVLIDTHDGFWAKEWKRIRAREKRKYQEEIQERVEEIQDEIAEVEQQIVEVKQAPKPKKATPARDFYAEQARIVEHLIARRNQLIDEEDEELLLLL